MVEKSLSRREREKRRHRQEILSVAFALFSEKGYNAVSMKEISERAEFALGTIYRFFRSKAELFGETLLSYSRTLYNMSVEAIEGKGTPVERVAHYVREKGRLFEKNVAFVRLFFTERHDVHAVLNEKLYARITSLHARFIRKLSALFREGIDKGFFRRGFDPTDLAISIEGLSNTFLYYWIQTEKEAGFDERVDVLLSIFFGPVLNDSRKGSGT